MIGIICAMQVEADGIIALAENTSSEVINDMSFISGTLNGDDVDFNIYVDDNGSVSGSFTNYTIGAGFDVAGTMTANSLSFYSLNNSVTWKFKANRTSGNNFSGTCSSSNITYSMYLNVEHQ